MTKEVPTLDAEVTKSLIARRDLLSGTAAAMATAALAPTALRTGEVEAASSTDLDFVELPHGIDETHHVSPGFTADVLVRWGDPLFADSPDFKPDSLTASSQAKPRRASFEPTSSQLRASFEPAWFA